MSQTHQQTNFGKADATHFCYTGAESSWKPNLMTQLLKDVFEDFWRTHTYPNPQKSSSSSKLSSMHNPQISCYTVQIWSNMSTKRSTSVDLHIHIHQPSPGVAAAGTTPKSFELQRPSPSLSKALNSCAISALRRASAPPDSWASQVGLKPTGKPTGKQQNPWQKHAKTELIRLGDVVFAGESSNL